jgi:hypothetical protein
MMPKGLDAKLGQMAKAYPRKPCSQKKRARCVDSLRKSTLESGSPKYTGRSFAVSATAGSPPGGKALPSAGAKEQ